MRKVKIIQMLNLVVRRIAASKVRSIFIFITITATFVLISSVIGFGINYYSAFEQQQIKLMGTTAHAGLSHPTEEQYNKIQQSRFVDCIGLVYDLGWIQTEDNLFISMAWYDQTEWEYFRRPAFDNVVGNYPEYEFEIMTSTWVLDKIGVEPRVGEKIKLTYNQDGIQKAQVFTLSGYYDSYLNIRSDSQDYVLFSDEFKSTCQVNITENAAISIRYGDETKIQELTNVLSQDLHINDNQVLREVPRYNINESARQMNIFTVIVLVALFMFTSYIMVYNILFLSFEKSVRFFGILKLAGMTSQELKINILCEVFILCGIAMPLGMLIYLIIMTTSMPHAMQVLSGSQLYIVPNVEIQPQIFIFASLFTIISVCCSCIKPMQYVSKVSPVSSSKFSVYDGAPSNMCSIQGKMYKLAWRNVFRSKKRAIYVVISLSLAISCYAIMASLLGSIDSDQYVKKYIESDFSIHNPSQSDIEWLNGINGLSNCQVTQIQPVSVKYDKEVFKRYVEEKSSEFSQLPPDYLDDNFRGYLIVVDEKSVNYMQNTLNVAFDVDSFIDGKSAIVEAGANLFDVGDSVEFQWLGDSKWNQVQIGGILRTSYKYSGQGTAPNLYVTSKYLSSHQQSMPYLLYQFDVESDSAEMYLNQLEGMFGDAKVTSRIETKMELDEAKKTLYLLGTGIAAVIFLVGCLNFVNTFSVNIIARRTETAMMESVGMTRRQSTSMFVFEGLIYALTSSAVSIASSILLSKLIYTCFSMQDLYGAQKLPYTELLISIFVLCIISFIIPLILVYTEHCSSIVTRLHSDDSI